MQNKKIVADAFLGKPSFEECIEIIDAELAKRKSKYNYLQIAGGTLAGFGGAKLLDYGIVSLWELAINKPGITKVAQNTGLSEDLVFEWLDYQINAGMVYRGELDADEFNKNILPNYTITVPQLNAIMLQNYIFF